MKTEVQGRFKLMVYKADGSLKEETPWNDNIVLNQGLNLLGVGAVMSYCRIGTGSSVPRANQIELDNQVAASATRQGDDIAGVDPTSGYIYQRCRYRFDTGEAQGTIAEVGLGTTASEPNTLFNRALIRDVRGAITSIVVLEDETLDVLVEFRSYMNLETVQSVVNLGETTYTVRVTPLLIPFDRVFRREAAVVSAHGRDAPVSSNVQEPGRDIDPFRIVQKEYGGDHKRTFEIYWGLNQGLLAPLRTVIINTTLGSHQVEFSPAIPKTSEDVLRLTFEMSWGRYE